MSNYLLSPLAAHHKLNEFYCGNNALDYWLKNQALRAHKNKIAAVSVWADASDNVVGYFAISPTEVINAGLSRRYTAGYSTIPAWLLGRLALDQTIQGQGLGKLLLRDALETIITASHQGGGRLIVVDPIDEQALSWYLQFGFRVIERANTVAALPRVYLTVADAEKSI